MDDPKKPHEEYQPPDLNDEADDESTFADDYNDDFRPDLMEEYTI